MKNLIIVFMIITNTSVLAQKKEPCCIVLKNLVGTWQRGSNITGNGLNQNFVFFSNGTFVLNLGNDGDDARDIIKLKGRFRLVKDHLYFTITSKTIVEGRLEIGDMGVTSSIFQYAQGAKIKEIAENDPKEMEDPCYLTMINTKSIKLNNSIYYKIK